jgi:hypothetical protein
MIRQVFKYPINIADGHQTINLPRDFRIVMIAPQGNHLFLWAEIPQVEPGVFEELVPVRFAVFGTGHEIEDGSLEHVGSVVMSPFVWHVYMARDDI